MTCERLDKLEDWICQSREDQDLQKLAKEYISLIQEGNRSLERGEHHVIADSCWEETKRIRKQIKQRGHDFIAKANALIRQAKLDNYLIEE